MRTLRHLLPLLLPLLAVACQPGPASPRSRAHSAPTDARQTYERALQACDADSTRQARQLLDRAVRQAIQAGDLHTLYLAQLQQAQILAWADSRAALAAAKQALATYERHPDSDRNLIIILDNIATYASQLAYNEDGSFDESLDYARRAYALALAHREVLGSEQLCQTLTTLANIHWAMGDGRQALHCARQAAACATADLRPSALRVLARCLVSCDSLAAAEALYRSLPSDGDLKTAYVVQSSLAKLALRRGDPEAAEQAIDSAFAHAEELYHQALHQQHDYYQTALRQQRANEQLRYRTTLHRRTLGGAAALLLLLAAAAAYVLRQRWRLHRRTMALQQRELRLQARQNAAQQEQLRQRDGIIDLLQNFILQRSAVIQKLEASTQRHVALTPREWAEVERTLDAIDSDRFVRLRRRFPDLREEDVQLCILTRLRLTNRAIGNIYAISISAVQHRKLKLKKEVFGEHNPERPFEQVLENL